MKVSVIQMDVKFNDSSYNYLKAEELIRKTSLEKPDVICLPETWNLGFFPKENLSEICDKNGEKTKNFIGNLAKELSVNIVAGSVINLKDNKIYNTSLIFNKEGECVAEYDKIHLFSPMDEHHYFESGKNLVTFELNGIKCGIIICYDLRFLELIRSLALKGISVLFVVAQWPLVRKEHWEILNKARAIENQIYVVSTNACGLVGETKFGGHSLIVNPSGKVLISASENETIMTANLDFEFLKQMRATINVYNDRKKELYQID